MKQQQEAWKEERERGISKMIGLLKFITCGSVDDGKSRSEEPSCRERV